MAIANTALNSLSQGLWQTLSIGLSVLILVAECLWLTLDEPIYLAHARHWAKLLVIDVAIEALSSLPSAFAYCAHRLELLHSESFLLRISPSLGDAIAALLEVAVIIMVLKAWNHLSRNAHLLVAGVVAVGSTLTALYATAREATVRLRTVGTDIGMWPSIRHYATEILRLGMEKSIPYLWLGSITTSLAVVAGVSAWKVLRREQSSIFAYAFKASTSLLLVVVAVQILMTSSDGMAIFSTEPLRIADGVNASLLVLSLWTISSRCRASGCSCEAVSEGPFLVAWVLAAPMSLVGNEATLVARMTRSATPTLQYPGAGYWVDGAFQVLLAAVFLWLASRWLRQRLDTTTVVLENRRTASPRTSISE